MDGISNTLSNSLVIFSPLYVDMHIVFVGFGQPATYISKPSKYIDVIQSNP